jgi:signal transduction histidine kinase
MEPSGSDVERLERRIAELERENARLREQAAALPMDEERVLSILSTTLAKAPVGFVFFDSELRYALLNEEMAAIHGVPAEARLGRTMREVSPVNAVTIEPVLERVFSTGEPVMNLEFAGETLAAPGERRYWLTGFFPVRLPDGSIPWVGASVVEVTEQRRAELESQRLFEALELERSRLASTFLQAPAFIATLSGPEHVFELANPSYYQLVGHRDILHKTVREALPEIEGQGFFELLDEVYATGRPFVGNEVEVYVRREEGGPLEQCYVNFVYQPLLESDGEVSGIFVHGVDVTDLVRTTEALREADRRKDEFLAMLGHELRNPLAPIRNAVQILRQGGGDASLVVMARDMIDRQVSHLVRLVDDLLDISRISRGKILLRMERLDLARLVRETVEDHRRALEAGGLALELTLPAGPVWVEGDPTRLAQALGNLLSNAGKFTDPGGRVEVALSVGSGRDIAEVVVRDTGIGMDPDMMERLFEAFSQADRTLDRSRGGLGLGLALVKGLVDMHGGEVLAASAGLDQGSCFTLRLPLAGAA